MRELHLETLDGRTALEPGEWIDVMAQWQLAERPERLELRLLWHTRGKGTRDVGLAHTEAIESPHPADFRRVRFQLPEGPYSFSGKLVSLQWTLELVVLPGETATSLDLVVAPQGREVVLASADTDAKNSGLSSRAKLWNQG